MFYENQHIVVTIKSRAIHAYETCSYINIMHPYYRELAKVLGLSRKAGYFRLNIWLLYEGSISAGLLMRHPPMVIRPSITREVEWADYIINLPFFRTVKAGEPLKSSFLP